MRKMMMTVMMKAMMKKAIKTPITKVRVKTSKIAHLNVHPRLTDHGQNQLSPHTTIKQDQSQHQK